VRDTGRTVLEARDGVEALSKLEKLPRPCLILLDLMMPRMDGHEFMGHLRDRYSPAEFRVLVISATTGSRLLRGTREFSELYGSLSTCTGSFRCRGVLLNSLHD
jgi:CheY-like chemotaxis protein